MRQLKHHEQRLLKHVDFLNYKQDQNHRDLQVIRRYHIQNREDYFKYLPPTTDNANPVHRYNQLVGACKKLVHRLSMLDPTDPYRLLHEQRLMQKLYHVGVINSLSQLSQVENKLSVSAFCRRRIAVVMARLKMCETVSAGVRFVEQGHVRVGPEVITDPAYLVPRKDFYHGSC